jgi:hypothetical protein
MRCTFAHGFAPFSKAANPGLLLATLLSRAVDVSKSSSLAWPIQRSVEIGKLE